MKWSARSSVMLAFVLSLPGFAASASAGSATLSSGIDRSAFDTSIKPGQDFFQYVNGNWIKRNPIPPDQTAWGVDQQLHEQNLIWLREIIESIGPEITQGDRQKIRDFYRTATDAPTLQKQGASPLREEFERIGKIANRDDLIALIGHHHLIGADTLFSFGIGQDQKDSSRYAAQLFQGGLGLPERDYYLGDDADSKRIRGLYHDHVAKLLGLLGDATANVNANAGADVVLRIETELARVSRTPVQNRDVEALYNKLTIEQLKAAAPQINWALYFKTIGASSLPYVIVGQPEFFTGASRLLTSIPIESWQTYLRWQLIHSTAGYLSDPFEQENFRFYRGVLAGAKEMQPRWKRAIHVIDQLMGQPLGRLYVDKHFPPAARDRINALVGNIVAAYRERIASRDWMSEQTKVQAQAKLTALMRKIGYPEKWRDYGGLEIRTDSYVQNVLRARTFEFEYWLHKLGGPVDRTEWEMSPPTVNAYYDPSLNEIVFPAGILQPPYFDPGADDAVNYGAIGAVIGHEMTHGFDDQGCLFDAAGNMKNWWTPQDKTRFEAKTKRLVEQFDACVAVDDVHVNGKLTLGENIADLGGLTIAYAAYQKSLAGRAAPAIDGFTGPQRFFVGFAQSWRCSTRPQTLRMRVRVDPHSPERFRVNIPVSNLAAFYDAFHISPGDPMYRPEPQRVQVW